MKKTLAVGAVIAVIAGAAFATTGLNFTNAQGIITADLTDTACVVGTSRSCPLPIAPWGVLSASTTHSSGNVATSNAFQTALSGSTARLGCMISNTSTATEYIDVGSSPSMSTAVALPAGAKFNCGAQAGVVINDQLNITSATAGSTYVVWAQ